MNLRSQVRGPVAAAALTLTLMLSGAALLPKVDGAKFGANATPAAATRYRVVWYYSDASYTTRVGIGTFYCNGRAGLSGRSTPYSIEVANEPCCGTEIC